MKNFDTWNVIKKGVQEKNWPLFVKERDVWYTQLGVNIGNEEDGKGTTFKRPVLVAKKFGNMFLVIPMTTGGKDSKFYYSLPKKYFWKVSRLIFSQVRFIDKKRFTHKIARINEADFLDIKEKLTAVLL